MKTTIPGSKALLKYTQITLLSLALCEALTGCPGSGSSDQGNNIKNSVNNPAANVCENGKIQIGTTVYTSIQSAIDAAKDSDVVSVGMGVYNEALVIKSKTNLTLQTICGAQVNSIQVIGSKNIAVSGFYINTGKAKYHGILIGSNEWSWSPRNDDSDDICGSDDDQEDKDSNVNENITITNNIVSNVKNYPAVMVKGNAKNIQVINNAIYNNYEGVVFFPSGKFSNNTHTISQNRIYMNDYDGLMIWGEHTRYSKNKYVITSNSINQNGQKKISRYGYGLKIIGAMEEDFNKRDPSDDKDAFLIQNNVIAFNNGQVEKNRSTIDIYRYRGLFDSQDTGNQTSTGSEAPGIVAAFTYTQPPVIEMVSANNFLTRTPSYLLLGSVATPAPVTVTVTQNGKIVSSSNNYQIYVPLTLTEGQNTIVISVVDYFGNKSTSTISCILDTIPALLTSLIPANGSTLYTNHFPFTVAVTGTTNEAIQSATVNGSAAVLSDSKTFSANAIFNQAGDNTITLQTTDLAGNIGTYTRHVTIIYDVIPPAITLGLADGLTVSASSVDLPVSVAETLPLSCVFNVNSEDIFTTTAQNFIAPVSLTNEGSNTIKVTCTDAAGNVGVASVNIIKDTIPPIVLINNPLQGSFFNTLSVPISGQANENISSASVNGQALNVLSDRKSFSGFFQATTLGSQSLQISVADSAGNVTTQNIQIIIDTTPAKLVITAPKQNQLFNSLSIAVSGTSNKALSSINLNSTPLALGTDGKSFTGVFQVTADGLYLLQFVATDLAGNMTSVSVQIRVLQSLPQQLIDNPPIGLVWGGTGFSYNPGGAFADGSSGSVCQSLDQIFANSGQIGTIDPTPYLSQFPSGYTPNIPNPQDVMNFIGTSNDPLNSIKTAYLVACKGLNIVPDLNNCQANRGYFNTLMGEYPEELILDSIPGLDPSLKDFLLPRFNICSGLDLSNLSCSDMVDLLPFISDLAFPGLGEILSSPAVSDVIDQVACSGLTLPQLPNTLVPPPPVNITFSLPSVGGGNGNWGSIGGGGGGSGGGSGAGGSSNGCGYFAGQCGITNTSGNTQYSCSDFPQLWFCAQGTGSGLSEIVVSPSYLPADPNSFTFGNIFSIASGANVDPGTVLSSIVASDISTSIPGFPKVTPPILTVTSPTPNQSVTDTVRVTGRVSDISSLVKVQGQLVSTLVTANGLTFDVTIPVPQDGVVRVEAADIWGNVAVPVSIYVVSQSLKISKSLIAAGVYHNCVITNSGTKCWGDNSSGQLGDGTLNYSATMVSVTGLPSLPSEVTAGEGHTCALVNGEVYCWGSNTVGQLGQSTGGPTISTTALKVENLQNQVTSISAGQYFTCALLIDGNVQCWGGMLFGGSLGNGTVISSVPIVVSNINNNAVKIQAGYRSVCALLGNNGIMCWGADVDGQMGAGNNQNNNLPTPVLSNFTGSIIDLTSSYDFSCAAENTLVRCWGANYAGQLGIISADTNQPTNPVSNLVGKISNIFSGHDHSCAVLDNQIFCWGKGTSGQLGTSGGNNGNLSVFDVTQISSMALGADTTCVLSVKGEVYCWGAGYGIQPQKVN